MQTAPEMTEKRIHLKNLKKKTAKTYKYLDEVLRPEG